MHGLVTGNKRAPLSARGDDLYETPAVAVEALLRVEELPHRLWEPCCGPGAIVRVLRAHGHDVFATDLVDYASPDQDAYGRDFLMEREPMNRVIVTNPPFKTAARMVAKGLDLAPRVIMLLRLAFLESETRRDILDGGKLARVHVFRNRLPMMHRSGRGTQITKTASSAMAIAWFVWCRDHQGPTELRRLSWEPSSMGVPKCNGKGV